MGDFDVHLGKNEVFFNGIVQLENPLEIKFSGGWKIVKNEDF